MLHVVEVLKKKKKKNIDWGPVNIYHGGGKGDGRGFEGGGGQRIFRRNRRRIKRHQQSIKLGTIEN